MQRQAEEIQAQGAELERQAAELDQLSDAERQEGERQIADEQFQLGEMQRQLENRLNDLDQQERQAEDDAAQRQEEQRQHEEHQEDQLRHVTPILEAIAGAGVPVPILPFPAVPGEGEDCSGAFELLVADDGFVAPMPAVLPAGDYDVYVFVDLWNEEMGNESQQQCVTLTASVAGETVVKAPQLGDC